MKLSELHKHLYSYDDRRLHTARIGGRAYRTDLGFRPTIILCLSFGKSDGPDSYNARLAQMIEDARHIYGRIPAIAQREVSDLYLQHFGDPSVLGVCKRVEKDTYVDTDVRTKDALDEMRQLIIERELDASRVLYIAHPAHLFRVLSMGRKTEVRGRPLEGMPFVDLHPSYNTDDGQRFVRDPKVFAAREFGARLHHKMRGWL